MTTARILHEQKTESKRGEIKALSKSEMASLRQGNAAAFPEVKAATQERAEQATRILDESTVLLDSKEIDTIIEMMASCIHQTLRKTAPLVLTLYPGGTHFSNRLTKQLGRSIYNLTLEENYLDFKIEENQVTSVVEPLVDLYGRTILLVDTVLMDGIKLKAALDYCTEKGARAIYCATLIDMPEARHENLKALSPSIYGLRSPKQNLIGFGFAVDGFFQNIPEIRGSQEVLQPASSLQLLDKILKNIQPLVFQSHIPCNSKALHQAEQAENTFKQLELLYDHDQLEREIKFTANYMKSQLKNKHPVILSMLKGGSHFTTYLTELLAPLPLEESYMQLARYGNSQKGGKIRLLAEPAIDIRGRTVIISDDLIEGGQTIQMALSVCLARGASEVYVATLGHKPFKRAPGLDFIQPDFYCFRFDERFLVGMGMDEKENLRNKFGVWAHRKAEPHQGWKPIKQLAIGAALLGAGLFAYRAVREAVYHTAFDRITTQTPHFPKHSQR